MSKYSELNEIFCNNLKIFFELEDTYFKKAKEIKYKYCEYMEILEHIKFWTLDENINLIQEVNDDFYSKYTSPMKKSNDGFWYFSFLLNFKKSENDTSFVKGSYPVICGIKFLKDNSYEIKIKDNRTTKIKNANDLIEVFDYLNVKIKNSLNENLNLILKSSSKIGF